MLLEVVDVCEVEERREVEHSDAGQRRDRLVDVAAAVDAHLLLELAVREGPEEEAVSEPALDDDRQHADSDAEDEATRDVYEDDGRPGGEPHDEVVATDVPVHLEVDERLEQRHQGDDDDGRQHTLGEQFEDWRHDGARKKDKSARDDARQLRLATGGVVHETAGWSLGPGETVEERTDDVTQTVRYQLLVRVDRVAVLLGEHLRHRDGDGEAEDGDDDGVHDVRVRVVEHGQRRRRDSLRYVPDDGDAEVAVEIAEIRQDDADGDDDEFGRDGRLEVLGVAYVDDLLEYDEDRDTHDRENDVGNVHVGDVLQEFNESERDLAGPAHLGQGHAE